MSIEHSYPENKSESLLDLARDFTAFVEQAIRERSPLHEVEPIFLAMCLKMGRAAMEQFIALQGQGDVGPTVVTREGRTLVRSEKPVDRPLRTIFGTHVIHAHVYSRGPKTAIELRPVDAQLCLPSGHFSYYYEQFSQYFCVDQAFGQAARGLEMVLGQTISVDSLERINRRVGEQAGDYLQALPTPPRAEEGELLVLTADGKGVPLVKEDAQRIAAFEDQPERPGNRRMATVAAVYSVDRHIRTPEEIVAALFREAPSSSKTKRPEPQFKHVVACFPRVYDEEAGDDAFASSGPLEAFAWAAGQIETRRVPGQTVIRLMDGQPSLWSAAAACVSLPAAETVEILDILHVASYVWRAAKVFHPHQEQQEAFARERLLRILRGAARGVISGLRQTGTKRKLTGAAGKELATVCNYLERHAARLRYDEYLRAGYPIATGVIEGACRHLVKDRMERSGMRWRLEGARSMLNVRAVFQSSYWEEFQVERIRREQAELHANWKSMELAQSPQLSI